METKTIAEADHEPRTIRCPRCAKETGIKVYEDTVLLHFPLYCSECKTEYIINVMKFEMCTVDKPGG